MNRSIHSNVASTVRFMVQSSTCEQKWLQSGVKLKCFAGAKACQTLHICHYGLGLVRNYVKWCWENSACQNPNSISSKILPCILENCLSLGNQCFWLSLSSSTSACSTQVLEFLIWESPFASGLSHRTGVLGCRVTLSSNHEWESCICSPLLDRLSDQNKI